MAFVNSFFKKDGISQKISESDIYYFIERKIEENINLDYKAIDSGIPYPSVAKTICAFANSSGGLLILGISEERVKDGKKEKIFPERITWGNPDLKREVIEQKLQSLFQYPLKFRLIPIRKKDSKEAIFLIDVPQSDFKPHMFEYKYYMRQNFQNLPMEHYLVETFFKYYRVKGPKFVFYNVHVENPWIPANPGSPSPRCRIKFLWQNNGDRMGFLYTKSYVEIYQNEKIYQSKKIEWKCPAQAETQGEKALIYLIPDGLEGWSEGKWRIDGWYTNHKEEKVIYQKEFDIKYTNENEEV